MRIKIAAERALAYFSCIYTDCSQKSANILLDQNYSAKVCNFGTSRFLPPGHSQLTTSVEGTYGYLDPEYFHSNRLTEKIDVYSFGVVLVELLTGQKAISFDLCEGEINLLAYLVQFEKIDWYKFLTRIDELKRVAKLSEWCLRVKSEERPTMKEVALELEALRSVENHPTMKEVALELEALRSVENHPWMENNESKRVSICYFNRPL